MADEADENIDSTNDTTEEVENTEEVEETVADTETEDEVSELDKLKKQNQKLFERAKKAEGFEKQPDGSWVKVVKKPKVEVKQDNKSDPSLSEEQVEEKILRAQGLDDDAIDEARYIAGRKKISLIAATQDERFIKYKKEAEDEKKKEEAALGASKGAGRKKSEPDFKDPNLTAEQHREMAAKRGIK
jgi:hypothetical protein